MLGEEAQAAVQVLKKFITSASDEPLLIATYVCMENILRQQNNNNRRPYGLNEFTEHLSGDEQDKVREKMHRGGTDFQNRVNDEVQLLLTPQNASPLHGGGGGGGFF
jgi:hypothetical protein